MENFWKSNSDGEITVYQHLILEFLELSGFRYVKLNNQWRLIRISNHIVDFVDDTIEVQQFLINQIKTSGDFPGKEYTIELTLRMFKNVKKPGLLGALSSTDLNLIKGDQKTNYRFFRNGIVRTTAESIELLKYSEIQGNVLRSSIIDRDFIELENEKIFSSDFPMFLYRCMGMESSKFHSLMGILGYLSSSFKSSSEAKSVIFCDGVLADYPDGGTGKSLTAKALSYFNTTVEEDGKNFSFTSFTFQQVNFDTQLIIIDDVNKKLNFENFFTSITDGFHVEKKYQSRFTISFEESPRLLFTTNYIAYGRGNSFDRRIAEVEFSNYYGKDRKPFDEFGVEFFSGWNDDHWNLFYNFMVRCVQHYLQVGFVSDVLINDPLEKKLIRDTDSSFIEFAKEFEFKNEIRKSDLYDLFLEQYPNFRKWLTIKTFNLWIKSYFESMNIEYKEVKRDGGQRHWSFLE